MEIRESREGDVLVLAPDGDVAGAEATSTLDKKLGTALKTGFRHMILDCAGVGQLTSAAIRVLLMTSRKLDRTEGRLVLCGMNAKVQKAFSISGFDKDFSVAITREEALQRVLEPARPRTPKAVKAPPAKAAVIESPAQRAEAVEAAPAAVVEAAPATPVPASAAQVSASPTGPDLFAIATALLDRLGAHVTVPESATRIPRADLEALASGILATLRVGAS